MSSVVSAGTEHATYLLIRKASNAAPRKRAILDVGHSMPNKLYSSKKRMTCCAGLSVKEDWAFSSAFSAAWVT